tara:strand:+ start:38966 stop:39706 length:741 start_codon:yes stop_codon:yes gene_type:complete
MNDPAPQDAQYRQISELIQQARQQVQRSVNHTMIQTYWQIGRLIIEHEQQGESRAVYGTQQLETVSSRLTAEFGKGFNVRNLRNMRAFYQAFPIRNALRTELSWTQYRVLLRVNKPEAREWYLHEAAVQIQKMQMRSRIMSEAGQYLRQLSDSPLNSGRTASRIGGAAERAFRFRRQCLPNWAERSGGQVSEVFPIRQAVSVESSWTHFIYLIRLKSPEAREKPKEKLRTLEDELPCLLEVPHYGS